MSVKSESPTRPGGCSCRKMTSCSAPFSARQVWMRRSRVRRTPTPISGWRRRISSKMATGRRPGALFNKGTISLSQNLSQRVATAAATRRFLLRRQPRILFDPISGGGAEPGFGRGDGRRLDLAETHIQPHLAVGDVAPGQAAVPHRVKNPLAIGRPRPPENTAPCGAPPVARFATPVGLRPPFVAHPATLPHPDRRALLIPFAAQQRTAAELG